MSYLPTHRCPKCGDDGGWSPQYCGPDQRAASCPDPHPFADGTKHLLVTCRTCDWHFTTPCADECTSPFDEVLTARMKERARR